MWLRLLAGVEFGLQPLLHHTASGQALYCPYGLKVAVAAMVRRTSIGIRLG